MVIAPFPSKFAGLASKVTTCLCCRRSSAASSMVTILSFAGINADKAFRVVVLPEPVPPETKIFKRALTQASRNKDIFSLKVPNETKSFMEKAFFENLRMVTAGPTRDKGGIIMLTREPSERRASTSGEDSSTRLPRGVRILSMILIR